ncbi:hypothetical protein A33O_08266 [Nitratireductor aquibiodomus RA22]|uniref:Uncharacterized protein n=1 Tax=Nitratireductor aquibiodomus RA22 TaxID=1189611 RepID=I5C128_9HYPH|nr:hypothetical protein A33O_08266 [Nitratireductor aquibiodomus RA22]
MSMVAVEEALQGGGGSSVPAWTPETSPRMTRRSVFHLLACLGALRVPIEFVILGLVPGIHARAAVQAQILSRGRLPAPIFRSSYP